MVNISGGATCLNIPYSKNDKKIETVTKFFTETIKEISMLIVILCHGLQHYSSTGVGAPRKFGNNSFHLHFPV